VLVVLDNASGIRQVRPLLPGAPGCVTVVTSREALPGLVARFGAWRLDLDLLPLAEAVRLLRAVIGPRVDADPGAAETLAHQCARLPLALRVAAEIASGRPAEALTEHSAALGLAAEAGERYEQARAHQGLAAAYHASGDLAAALVHWRQALRRYARLGSPEADEVRARLAAASDALVAVPEGTGSEPERAGVDP
jgi:tetratricopeptide (TPR) repeat protein